MSKKTERPTNEIKESTVKVRLSKSDIEKLQFCYSWTQDSKSEIIREGVNLIYDNLKKYIESKEIKRVFAETMDYNIVLFVDKNKKAYVIPETVFDEELTFEVAKSTSYANLAGCDTADGCQWCMGGIGDIIDYNENDYENITEF